MTIIGDGKCTWEGLDEFLPDVLNDSEFLFGRIVLHVQYTFQLVAYCEVLHVLTSFNGILLPSLIRLLDVLALAKFEVVKPAFGLERLLLDVLPRVILDYLHLLRHILR